MNFHFNEHIMQNHPMKVITFKKKLVHLEYNCGVCTHYQLEKVDVKVSKL